MSPQQAIELLRPALDEHECGTFRFACPRALLIMKVANVPARVRFTARDRVLFRVVESGLIVEDSRTGMIKRLLPWEQIECLAAGEPVREDQSVI